MSKMEFIQAADVVIAILTFGGFSLEGIISKYGARFAVKIISFALIAAYLTIISVEGFIIEQIIKSMHYFFHSREGADNVIQSMSDNKDTLLILVNILLICLYVLIHIREVERAVINLIVYIIIILKRLMSKIISVLSNVSMGIITALFLRPIITTYLYLESLGEKFILAVLIYSHREKKPILYPKTAKNVHKFRLYGTSRSTDKFVDPNHILIFDRNTREYRYENEGKKGRR